ncbi:MAG: hypothetical protein CMO81_01355 [Waddliaceae bacterium]|nr:hypothetical protein [Waddliaceae bacterium]
MNRGLSDSERFGAFFLCFVLCLLIFFTYTESANSLLLLEGKELENSKIKVYVEGEVVSPGFYELDSGVLMEELLRLASPLPGADLRKVRKNRRIYDGDKVFIPELPLIEVQVGGPGVRSQVFVLYEGSPKSNLIDLCEFHPQAKINSLKAKRPLKNGEYIHVSLKK